MIRHPAFLACALLPLATLLSAPVAAQDSRIVTRWYDPKAVVTLSGVPGIQSTVTFADDERIENVAVGDSATWQVTPNKRANLLFVKPVVAKAHTNMTVVTDQRTYLFDLVAAPKAQPLYVLRFSYPPKPTPPPATIIVEAPKPTVVPTALNFAWVAKGDKKLVPTRTFDDGKATYLAWHGDVALPAILVRDDKGVEGPINYSVKNDYIVVDGVPAMLVLRAGRDMATLTPAAAASRHAGAEHGARLSYNLDDEPPVAAPATRRMANPVLSARFP